MTENAKKLLEDLKEIMMDLYRSAGQLDDAIRSIESEDKENELGISYMRYFVTAQANYRDNFKDYNLYKDLEKREVELWSSLINEIMRES